MISITKLREADKGREVVYQGGAPNHREYGVISSWNDKYIFVRYSHGSTAVATDPSDLEFSL